MSKHAKNTIHLSLYKHRDRNSQLFKLSADVYKNWSSG